MTATLKLTTLVLLLAAAVAAHEQEEYRAALVLRDRTYLSVTLYLAYPEALWQAVAPQRPFAAFLLACSAMSPEDLQKQLHRAQSQFERSTHVYLPDREAALANWSWPDATVQAMLRRRVMQAIADPDAHRHEPPVEVHADPVAPREIVSVPAQFPEEWRRVLVVWFRPEQQWVEGGSRSAEMKLGGDL